ncbi:MULTISPECIES: hypothetical protein [unclassified Methanoregula]|uniref:hypothetical protein n=1 Tax=unclassified Methanoregula TaxID=2649730 RepID=UPI0025DD121C|nr:MULTISPECIES: hypothetical protein [unclassified Methanoregula]
MAIFICLVIIAPVSGTVSSTGSNLQDRDIPLLNNTILTAERDVLSFDIEPNLNSTANLSLIIHHEAWIFNYYPDKKTVSVTNLVPVGRDTPVHNHTVFGNRSLMQQSNIPNLFFPKKTQVLESAQISGTGNQTQYGWNNITIDPNCAVIIAYSHDFTEGSRLYNGDQINLPGVTISRNFSERDSSFILNYSLKNTGPVSLHNANLNVFFPEKANGIPLIESAVMNVTSPCGIDIADKTTYTDGTGHFSAGKLLLSDCTGDIMSGGQQNYLVTVTGKKQNSGMIFPTVILNYRADTDPFNASGSMNRIWPGVNLVTGDNVNISRYYYYEASVAIPETKFFVVSPDGSGAREASPSSDATRSNLASSPLPLLVSLFALCLAGIYVRVNRR